MGVHISLRIDPLRISPEAWAEAFDEVSHVLGAWRPRLMRLALRTISGQKLRTYTTQLRSDEADTRRGPSLTVVGDLESLMTAETHRLYRHLEVYRGRDGSPGQKPPTDIVLQEARELDFGHASVVEVLGSKTQGLPCHDALLAVGMCVEARFPDAANVSGDIDRGQAERVQRKLETMLGRKIPLPVRVEPERLVERLSAGLRGNKLAEALKRLLCGDGLETRETVMRQIPRAEARTRWLTAMRDLIPDFAEVHMIPRGAPDDAVALLGLTEIAQLGPEQRQSVALVTQMALEVVQRVELETPDLLASPQQTRAALASFAVKRGPTLTDEAWDRLEQEDDPFALRFWLGLMGAKPRDYDLSHVRRAIFERAEIGAYALGLARDSRRLKALALGSERHEKPS